MKAAVTNSPTMSPTQGPTRFPTVSPTKTPTSTPSAAPSSSPSQSPTVMPTSRPTTQRTLSPDFDQPSDSVNPGLPSLSACNDAYVWCPGRSTCFSDPRFNCYTKTKGRNVWGWNIEYQENEGLVDECVVIMGATDCDPESGIVIGNATISTDEFIINIKAEFASQVQLEYSFYAGECRGNDGGQVLDLGICLADTIARLANDPDEFPLSSGTISATSFIFDKSISPREFWGSSSYSVFPIGGASRHYLTSHVGVCPI